MKQVIIGTAGHVDHGKTTLIKALTGVDTDRLKEEQLRGMTIDLGFASLRLPNGMLAGIVDVPGHERFLKNMLAGATGIDVALLVIAADEGVRQQTREHLHVLQLLHIPEGVVAITKMDVVDSDWTDAVEDEVRETLKPTFLADVQCIRVSAATGKGIEALKRALMSAASRAPERSLTSPFRIPVDRVFTRPGFGTVVTGTLASGTIRIGDAVELAPSGILTRVRGLQVHGAKTAEAQAGSRVAVNLAGVEPEQVYRGMQVSAPGSVRPVKTFDASLEMLANSPAGLKDQARVRVHIGTAEISGRVRLLADGREAQPGAHSYIRFRADREFACTRGDRYVLRTASLVAPIAGGTILDTDPPRQKRSDTSHADRLQARERGEPADILESILARNVTGMAIDELARQAAMGPEAFAAARAELVLRRDARELGGVRLIHSSQLRTLEDRAREQLAAYHAKFPLRAGVPREELRAGMARDLDSKTFNLMLGSWHGGGWLKASGTAVWLSDFTVALNERQAALLERIEDTYRVAGIACPELAAVCEAVNAPPDAVESLIQVAVTRQSLVRLPEGQYYHAATVEALKALARTLAETDGGLVVGRLRDETGTNRKWALQALEYLDAIRFTRRDGDARILMPEGAGG